MLKNITYKTIFLFFLLFFISVSNSSASPSYSSANGITFSAIDNIHNIPQLYSALVGVYGQSTTDNSIMKQIGPNVWQLKTGLSVPNGGNFAIDGSTVSELRIGRSSGNGYVSLEGPVTISNTKLIAWDFSASTPAGYQNGGYLEIEKPFHDAILNNFERIDVINIPGSSIYNVACDQNTFGMYITNSDGIKVSNFTFTNGDPTFGGGLTFTFVSNSQFSNVIVKNCGNYKVPATGSYGFFVQGDNNQARNIYVNGTGWSGMLFVGNNWTASNLTSINAGHNGIENEAVNNSKFDKIFIKDADQHNLFLKGAEYSDGGYSCEWMVNDVYSNITSSNPNDDNGILGAFQKNIIIKDSDFSLGNSGFTDLNGVNNSFINCTVHDTDAFGFGFQALDLGVGSYSSGNRIVDCKFSNAGYNIWDIDGDIHVLNPSAATVIMPYQSGRNSASTIYYYANIKVVNKSGVAVPNVSVTANQTLRNGNGNIQTTFYTDSNGKLTDRMAIPYQYTDFYSSTKSYSTKITASKDGKTNSTVVNPDTSWYSPDPSNLQSPQIVLVLDTDGSNIVLPVYPSSNFTENVTSGIAPLTVQFTDLSKNATGWNWNFGDGGTSILQSPTHIYTGAGTYTVTVTASNANGTGSKSATITVLNPTVAVLPIANFSSNVSMGIAPSTVQFTDISKNATGWSWNFGDGGTSTQQNPTHIYTGAGTYTVTLTASNSNGTNSKSATITVSQPPVQNPVPTAAFTASPTSGNAPLNVVFNDQSTGLPKSWYWDFGDGNSSTDLNPTHIYSGSGTYTVTLAVSNENCINMKKGTITVNVLPVQPPVIKPPTANFSAKPLSGKYPLNVSFVDSSTDSPSSWLWKFGDGNTSTDQNPVHMYSKVGNYTVSLTVTNNAGSSTLSWTKYISIKKI